MKIYTNPYPIDIIFENLTYSVISNERTPILNDLSGRFQSGQLTAILGPSGAGKTTLLNVLAGFKKNDIKKGGITIVNRSAGIGESSFNPNDACYISQDDELFPFFTVHEIMTMACNLKIGGIISEASKREMILEILEESNLTKTKDTRCAKLSFGEKKRLSIALELINNPPVMLINKPTTGLDSASSHQCITILKNLARAGRNIVCTIHQPSALVFEMFDHVYVLAKGRCVYQGTPGNVVPFLGSIGLQCPQFYNTADFVIEVINGEYGQFNSQLIEIGNNPKWRTDVASNEPSSSTSVTVTTFEVSDSHTVDWEMIDDRVKFHQLHNTPTEFQRFVILLKKCALKSYRDWTISNFKIVLHVLMGILIGKLYAGCGKGKGLIDGNSYTGFIGVSLLYLSFTSMMPAFLKFPSELKIVHKEQFNGWYKLTTFYCAFLVVNIAAQVVFTMAYVTSAFFFSSRISSYALFFEFSLSCLLINLISEGIGLYLGVSIPFNIVNELVLAPIYISILVVFVGFYLWFPFDILVPQAFHYLSYVSYFGYAFQIMLQTAQCSKSNLTVLYRMIPKRILDAFMTNENAYLFIMNITILFCFALTFYLISFIIFTRRIENERNSPKTIFK